MHGIFILLTAKADARAWFGRWMLLSVCSAISHIASAAKKDSEEIAWYIAGLCCRVLLLVGRCLAKKWVKTRWQ